VRELSAELPEGPRILVGRSITADRAAMRRLGYGFVAAGAGVLALGLFARLDAGGRRRAYNGPGFALRTSLRP
jgi:hypothetical protein